MLPIGTNTETKIVSVDECLVGSGWLVDWLEKMTEWFATTESY